MCYRPGTDQNTNAKPTIPPTNCPESCCKTVKISNQYGKTQASLNEELHPRKYQEINKSIEKVCTEVKPDPVIEHGLKTSIPPEQLTKSLPIAFLNEELQAKNCEKLNNKSIGKACPKVKQDPVIRDERTLKKSVPTDQLIKSLPIAILNEELQTKNCEELKNKSIGKACAKVKQVPVIQRTSKKSVPTDRLIESHPISVPQTSGNAALPKNFSKNNDPQEKQINSIKDIFKPCDDCYKTHQLNLQKLFKICEEAPDFVIEAYRKECLNDERERFSKDEYSQIKYTHGESLGSAEYHYLMADAFTSTPLEKTDGTGLKEVNSFPQLSKGDIENVEENELNKSLTSWLPLEEVQTVENKTFEEVAKDKIGKENSKLNEEHTPTDSSLLNSTENLTETPLFPLDPEYEQIPEYKAESEKKSLESSLEKNHDELQSEEEPGSKLISLETIHRQTEEKGCNSSEHEDTGVPQSKDYIFDDDQTKVSFLDFGIVEQSIEHKALLQSKRRMEQQLAKLMDQRKNLHKSSMLIDVVREEKQKSEIFLSLMDKSDNENDEYDKISEEKSIDEIPDMEKRSKCCGLIKTKKKDIPVASKTKNTGSVSSNEENNEERQSSPIRYRRRSSPVEKPIFEKTQIIKRYSHNL